MPAFFFAAVQPASAPSRRRSVVIIAGFLLDGSIAGIARSLSIPCRLRNASDACRRNTGASPSIWQRAHAFARRISGLGTRRKLSRAAHGENLARSIDVRSPGLQLFQAMDFFVHPFQCGGEHLLALQGMFGCARKILPSRPPLAARFTPLRMRQCFFFTAHIAQALAQSLEVIKP
jgi:hypothetical protein